MLLGYLLSCIYKRVREVGPALKGVRQWSFALVYFSLLVVVLSLASCGGGSSDGGGGGGGGGGPAIASVTVQGAAGGNAITLGTATISIP